MYTKFYESVKATLDHVDDSLSMTNSFNGTVRLPGGMYINSELVSGWAVQLNNSANTALESSETRLSEIMVDKSRVVAAGTRADAAQMTVEEAGRKADRAANYTATTLDLEAEFRQIYKNNTEKFMSLVTDRDAIKNGLTMYLEESQNLTKAAMDANETAGDALVLARQKQMDATIDLATADMIQADSDMAFSAAFQVYQNLTVAKNESVAASETATAVLAAIMDAKDRVDAKESVVINAEKTANDTLALHLPGLEVITDLSRQINETIVPEAEVNQTVADAHEALMRAQEVRMEAKQAL